jgi:hypothetical protein
MNFPDRKLWEADVQYGLAPAKTFACNCSRHVHVALVNWVELLLNLNRLKPLPICICYAVVLSWN